MSDVIVLLHGSASGSHSWGQVRRELASDGARIIAPDMLGYGCAPPPTEGWSIRDEVEHLQRSLGPLDGEAVHLVAHSLGAMFGLHLWRTLGPRVARITLIDPVIVGVLRDNGEDDGYAEMEAQYQRFMDLLDAPTEAARAFVEHWSGLGSWEGMSLRAKAALAALVPKIRLELVAARFDATRLDVLDAPPPPTTVVVGERTRIAPRAVARQLARAFDAATIVVPDAGHMVPLTHPAAVADAVRCRGRGADAGPIRV